MTTPFFRRISVFSLLALASACGHKSGPDDGAPSTTYPMPHTAMPQLVKHSASGVQTAPVLVAVTWDGDPLQADLDIFTSKVGVSGYWTAATSEYGVGPVVLSTSEHLTPAALATYTDQQVADMLTSHLDGTAGVQQFPAPTDNTEYLLYFPAGTVISSPGFTSCQNYGAYHTGIQVGQANVAYAIIPRCSGGGGLTDLDVATFSASHEMAEAATDPFGGGFWGTDTNNGLWDVMSSGGENGDMCEWQPDILTKPADIGYVVQSTWSNAAAAAGHNPCQPNAGPYFNAAPVLKDVATMNFGQGQSEDTQAVKIAVGKSRTIEIDLYSDADTGGPFDVKAVDYEGTSNPNLSFAWDRQSGVNGEKLHLTVTVIKAGSYFPPAKSEIFFLVAKQGTHTNLWPVYVDSN